MSVGVGSREAFFYRINGSSSSFELLRALTGEGIFGRISPRDGDTICMCFEFEDNMEKFWKNLRFSLVGLLKIYILC